MRLGPRLTVVWSIDAASKNVLVPQLLLQPLIENAVRHGAACSRDGGWVEITAHKQGGTLELRVSNSIGTRRTSGIGVGLKNTEGRLRNLYADEATFSFIETVDHTAVAIVVLPALSFAAEQSGQASSTEDTAMQERDRARTGGG